SLCALLHHPRYLHSFPTRRSSDLKTTRFIETERMVKQRVTVNAALFPESEQNCSYTFAYPPVLVEGLGNIDVCFGIKILHTPFLSNSVYCRQGLVLIQGWLPQVLPS